MAQKSKIDTIRMRDLAVRMINAGFKNGVIEVGTGQTNSMIRSLRAELGESEESSNGVNTGQLRQASRIVDNRRRMIDGGIIISAYLKLAEDAEKRVDFDALMETHEFYLEVHQDIYGKPFKPIEINEAYVLVRDFRCRDGSVDIHTCRCGADYISVEKQRMSLSCPICSLEQG